MANPFLEVRSLNSDTKILYMQHNELGKEITIPPHLHDEIEILHFTQGITNIFLPNRTVDAMPGQMAIINSRLIHSFAPKQAPCHYDCLIVNSDFLKREGIKEESLKFKTLIQDEEISHAFLNIKKSYYGNESYKNLKQRISCLNLFLVLIDKYSVSEFQNEKNNSQIQLVTDIINYIKNNISKQITIEELCSITNYSPSYIYRTFKKVTHHNIIDLTNSMKCDSARQLLINSDISVGDCAKELGFTNFSYFSKLYFKYIGELPSETRRHR